MNDTPSAGSARHCPDPAIVRDWLGQLYGHGQPGWLVPCHKDAKNGADFQTSDWLPAADLDTLADILTRHAHDGDVWLSVGTRRKRTSGRGKNDNVLALPGLWSDIDIAGAGHADYKQYPPDLESALDIVAKLPFRVWDIHSGHGLQVWAPFVQPVSLDDDPRLADMPARFHQLVQDIADELGGWDIDPTQDLARVMRVPGTINWKVPGEPALVHVLQADWSDRYTLDELDDLLPALRPAPAAPTRTVYGQPVEFDEWAPPRPGDLFNCWVAAVDVLTLAGWKFHPPERRGHLDWTRPGKDPSEGLSLTVYPAGDCCCWTTSTALTVRKKYDPWGLFVTLFHHGDFTQAARSWSQAMQKAGGIYTPTVLLDAITIYTFTEAGLHVTADGVTILDPHGTLPETPSEGDTQATNDDGPQGAEAGHDNADGPQGAQADDDGTQGAGAGPDDADGPQDPVSALERRLRSRLFTREQLRDLPRPQWMVDGWLFAGTLSVIYGRRASGKSLVTLDLAASIATGLPFHGHATARTPVLYVVAEGQSGVDMRLASWEKAHGLTADNLHVLAHALNMRDPVSRHILEKFTNELGAGLVILDTLARTMGGGDENGKDMGEYVGAADFLRERTGAAVLIVHHEPRAGGNPRGHGSLEGAADTIVHVSRTGDLVTATMADPAGKQKDAKPASDLTLKMVGADDDDSVHLVGTLAGPGYMLSHGEQQALFALAETDLGEGIPASRWESVSLLPSSTFWRAVKRLGVLGLTTSSGTGRQKVYTLTDLGKQRADSHTPN